KAAGQCVPGPPWRRRRNSGRRAARTAGDSRAARAASRSFASQVPAAILGERLGLRRKILQHEVHELGSRGGTERRIEATLAADGRAGLATQPFAAYRAPEVGGEELGVIGQGQDLAVQALVKLCRELRFRAGADEVGPTNPTREERIAGEDEPGLRSTRLVRDQDRDAVRRVPGRVDDRE